MSACVFLTMLEKYFVSSKALPASFQFLREGFKLKLQLKPKLGPRHRIFLKLIESFAFAANWHRLMARRRFVVAYPLSSVSLYLNMYVKYESNEFLYEFFQM